MRIKVLIRCLLAMAVAGLALPVLAATEADVNAAIKKNLGNPARYETTIKTFQQAVTAGTKEDVAAFVRYPITVTIDGHKRTINSSAAFIRNYDAIMTPDIVGAVKSQKYEDLLVNAKGIMFGQGQVWIDGICQDRHCRTSVPQVVTIQHADVN